jgi:DNA anti-recombination protein RmuC
MQNIDPEFRELKREVVEQGNRISRVEGEVLQLNRTAADNIKQTIWQFVAFTIAMAVILIGGLNYQTNALRNELGTRITKVEKRLEQRIDQVEKNMNARFEETNRRIEDLKQEIRRGK